MNGRKTMTWLRGEAIEFSVPPNTVYLSISLRAVSWRQPTNQLAWNLNFNNWKLQLLMLCSEMSLFRRNRKPAERKLEPAVLVETDDEEEEADYQEPVDDGELIRSPVGSFRKKASSIGATNQLAQASCVRCKGGFQPNEQMVNSNGEIYHEECFVCAQCFQKFPDGLYYEFEKVKYCEHDFHMLFAPCCGKCEEFIVGRVIKAMNNNWHPNCFTCQTCNSRLADVGFVKNAGRSLCRPCHNREKANGLGKFVCHKCHTLIDETPLRYKGDTYHPFHFNCETCGKELTSEARELRGELYCLPCHDKQGIPICGACRRPIEERVVRAMGKTWHVEHFVCAQCEKPFLGQKHYERGGLAYCETHFNQLFGDVCYHCNEVIDGDVVSALNKSWCVKHFQCTCCNGKLTLKNKFIEYDMKPVCRKCYEKFPVELKKRLKKAAEAERKH